MKTFLRSVLFLLALVTNAFAADGTISPVEAWKKIANGSLVVDVRSPEEFASGHIKGAINIPHDQIESRVSELGTDHKHSIVLYCRSGRRSGIAKATLDQLGFTDVVNAGGYAELDAAKPMVN